MLRARTAQVQGQTVKLDALPDVADFRDWIFHPTLTEVPLRMELERYRAVGVPVENQGSEGSCTGFALATVAHYLLRIRRVDPDATDVSARMLYEMAKRYDEWPGEAYEGSSARGAMKGWHKHGVCSEELWSYQDGQRDNQLTNARASDALLRPLGAYFRVNHRDLAAVHVALAEVGTLFATAIIHQGWLRPDGAGRIPQRREQLGGHAFAIVGYNEQGFWIQNSWGAAWGKDGYALLSYDDWLENAMDLWAARLGVPVCVQRPDAVTLPLCLSMDRSEGARVTRLRPHLINVAEDGSLARGGPFGTSEADVARMLEEDLPALTAEWPVVRVLLYANSGLPSLDAAVEQVARRREDLLMSDIYPLTFLWYDDLLADLNGILRQALVERFPDGVNLDDGFMHDRVDDGLEPLVRALNGRLIWQNVKEMGHRAHRNEAGAGRVLLKHLARLLETSSKPVEIHLLGHGAGSIFLAPLVQLLTGSAESKLEQGPMRGRTGHGLTIKSCTLWAPASTADDFKATYLPALQSGGIERLHLFTLNDESERDDHVAGIYHKSFLYLVAHTLEEVMRIPLLQPEGTPVTGMETHVLRDEALFRMFAPDRADWVIAPNGYFVGSASASRAQGHSAFAADDATWLATMARIRDVRS